MAVFEDHDYAIVRLKSGRAQPICERVDASEEIPVGQRRMTVNDGRVMRTLEGRFPEALKQSGRGEIMLVV